MQIDDEGTQSNRQRKMTLGNMLGHHRTQLYTCGSDSISDYLERVDPRALKKMQTGSVSPLKRSTNFSGLQFKLVEEGVDIASSSSEGEPDNEENEWQDPDGRGSEDDSSSEEASETFGSEAIMEENSAFEESPKMDRFNAPEMEFKRLATEDNIGLIPQNTLTGVKTEYRQRQASNVHSVADVIETSSYTQSQDLSPIKKPRLQTQMLDLKIIATEQEGKSPLPILKNSPTPTQAIPESVKTNQREDAQGTRPDQIRSEVQSMMSSVQTPCTPRESPKKSVKIQSSSKRKSSVSPKKSLRVQKSKSRASKKSRKSSRMETIAEEAPNQGQAMSTAQIMSLLTESEKNKIKRNIGDAFRRVLRQAEVKLILQKQPINRMEKEIDKLVNFLQACTFLKKDKNLQYAEFRELAQSLTYKQFSKDQNIYEYGEKPNDFYIMLNGTVGQMVRNDVIQEWEWAHNVYEALLQWKRDEFDKRVKWEMQLHLDRIKRETDQKQLDKLKSMKPGKYQQQGEEVNQMIAGTHIKIMDHVRASYFKSREQIQKEKEEQELQEKLEREREEERNEVMRFWQSHNMRKSKLQREQTQRESNRFDCERFVQLTPVERINLIQLKKFRLFKWWVEKQQFKPGTCFGQNAFEVENIEAARRKETMHVVEAAGVAVLNRSDYVRVLKKIEIKKDNCKLEFFRRVPFFQSFSSTQLKKLIRHTNVLHCQHNQFITQQGEEPTHAYIVQEGEFEILRNRKSNYHLKDPLTVTRFQEISNLKSHQIVNFLTSKKNSTQIGPSSTYMTPKVTSTKKNNTLFEGQRRQAGDIRIMIAGIGHLFGSEDISKGRNNTTSVRCISNTGSLVTIKADDFLNFLQKDEQLWDGFQNLTKERDQITIEKIRNNKLTVKKLTGPMREIQAPQSDIFVSRQWSKSQSKSQMHGFPVVSRQQNQSQLNDIASRNTRSSANKGHGVLDDISDSDDEVQVCPKIDQASSNHKKHRIAADKTININFSALNQTFTSSMTVEQRNLHQFRGPTQHVSAASPENSTMSQSYLGDKENLLKLPNIQKRNSRAYLHNSIQGKPVHKTTRPSPRCLDLSQDYSHHQKEQQPLDMKIGAKKLSQFTNENCSTQQYTPTNSKTIVNRTDQLKNITNHRLRIQNILINNQDVPNGAARNFLTQQQQHNQKQQKMYLQSMGPTSPHQDPNVGFVVNSLQARVIGSNGAPAPFTFDTTRLSQKAVTSPRAAPAKLSALSSDLTPAGLLTLGGPKTFQKPVLRGRSTALETNETTGSELMNNSERTDQAAAEVVVVGYPKHGSALYESHHFEVRKNQNKGGQQQRRMLSHHLRRESAPRIDSKMI